jgi:hypothetical protein
MVRQVYNYLKQRMGCGDTLCHLKNKYGLETLFRPVNQQNIPSSEQPFNYGRGGCS